MKQLFLLQPFCSTSFNLVLLAAIWRHASIPTTPGILNRSWTGPSAGSFDPHSTFQNCNENDIFFLRDVVVPALRNTWKSAFLCLAGWLSPSISWSPRLAPFSAVPANKKVEWLIDHNQVSGPRNYGGDRCKGGRGADFKVKCCLETSDLCILPQIRFPLKHVQLKLPELRKGWGSLQGLRSSHTNFARYDLFSISVI